MNTPIITNFVERSVEHDAKFIETLLSVVVKVREESPDGQISWNDVVNIMKDNFPTRKMTKESLRNRYRRLTDDRVHVVTQRKDDFVAGRMSLEEKVLFQIKRKRPMAFLCEIFGVDDSRILEAVAALQRKGYRGVMIWEEDGRTFIQNKASQFQKPGDIDLAALYGGETIRFAAISDTHIGSKATNYKALNKFYDYVKELGIEVVLHAGDLVDGYYTNRPTSILEQDAIGFQEQLRMFVTKFPKREGVTTYCITGNHDYTHMRNGMANIGESIAHVREDIVYLGHNFYKIPMGRGFEVSLIHPTDGSSANYLDKLKTIIERNPERRADIMLIGHYHKFAQMKYMGVYGYLMPAFQNKTKFMDDNNLTSELAGIIFEVKVDRKGNILSVKTEYVSYD